MLKAILFTAQAALLALVAYNMLTALWGWWTPKPAPRGKRRRRFCVVVPAHNEETVLEGLLEGLNAQSYPTELTAVWVVADRCSDQTEEIASRHARVAVRRDGPEGKGAALAWYLDHHPLAPDEALVVLDADNRVPQDLLARLSDELDNGHQVLQAYLDVTNPDESPLATASALSYWASNRMVQLARRNLGWSADLGGTGMCFTQEALSSVEGFAISLTEDQELGVRLALAGIPVIWLHDVRIKDEKPGELDAVVWQRARWMRGKRRLARKYGPALLGQSIRQRSAGLFDQAVRLVQPGRSFLALLTGLIALLAGLTGSHLLLPWPLWAAAAVVQVLLPVVFLAREGVEPRFLVRYPLLAILAALWLPIRLVSRRPTDGWYHTPHAGP